MMEEVKKLVLSSATVGELCMQISEMLPSNTQIRITHKGVRVTHSAYFDKLRAANDIDDAVSRNIL